MRDAGEMAPALLRSHGSLASPPWGECEQEGSQLPSGHGAAARAQHRAQGLLVLKPPCFLFSFVLLLRRTSDSSSTPCVCPLPLGSPSDFPLLADGILFSSAHQVFICVSPRRPGSCTGAPTTRSLSLQSLAAASHQTTAAPTRLCCLWARAGEQFPSLPGSCAAARPSAASGAPRGDSGLGAGSGVVSASGSPALDCPSPSAHSLPPEKCWSMTTPYTTSLSAVGSRSPARSPLAPSQRRGDTRQATASVLQRSRRTSLSHPRRRRDFSLRRPPGPWRGWRQQVPAVMGRHQARGPWRAGSCHPPVPTWKRSPPLLQGGRRRGGGGWGRGNCCARACCRMRALLPSALPAVRLPGLWWVLLVFLRVG